MYHRISSKDSPEKETLCFTFITHSLLYLIIIPIDMNMKTYLPLKDRLLQETRPLYLYGTGDGADKILDLLLSWNIHPEGIFVSEEFFRHQTFRDYSVTTLSELDTKYGPKGFVVLIAFGSHFPDMIQRIKNICLTHDTLIPDVPVAGSTLFDQRLLSEYAEQFQAASDLWEDATSREIFREIVDYKLSAEPTLLFDCVTPKEEVFDSLIPLSKEESYLDIGAYTGDTVREFLSVTGGKYRSITAMEPDPKTFKKLLKNTADLPHFTGIQAAAGNRTVSVSMVTSRGRGNRRSLDGTGLSGKGLQGNTSAGKTATIQFQRIDELSFPEGLPTYVKMDVEGAEKEAIEGAALLLQTARPKLNIALYHRSEDLFVLPLLLKKLLPDYCFYLRRHDCFPCWEVNLYARPKFSV